MARLNFPPDDRAADYARGGRCAVARMAALARDLDLVRRHGARAFVCAHVPLMTGVLWIAAQGDASGPAIGLSVIAMAHLVLHWLYRRHPANEFIGVGAWLPILGVALFGAAHLALVA